MLPLLLSLAVLLGLSPAVYDLHLQLGENAFTAVLTVDREVTPAKVSLSVQGHDAAIQGFTQKGDTLQLVTGHDGNIFVFALRAESDRLAGTVDYNNGQLKGVVTGTKRP